MAKSKSSWFKAPDEDIHFLRKNGVTYMSVEKNPAGKWYYYGLRYNSYNKNILFDDLEAAKNAAEKKTTELMKGVRI